MFCLLFFCSCLLVRWKYLSVKACIFQEPINSFLLYMISLIFVWCGVSLSWISKLTEGLYLPFVFFSISQLLLHLTIKLFDNFWHGYFELTRRIPFIFFQYCFCSVGWKNRCIFTTIHWPFLISNLHLIVSLPYGSLFCSLHLIRLLLFFHFKKVGRESTTSYLPIILKLLGYLWVASQLVSVVA